MHSFSHSVHTQRASQENTGLGAGHRELRVAEHPHSGALIIQKETGELVKAGVLGLTPEFLIQQD